MNSKITGEKNPKTNLIPDSIDLTALFTEKTVFLELILWKFKSSLSICLKLSKDTL